MDSSKTRVRRPIKKIVYVWNYRDWGGAQVYFASLISEAKKHFEICSAFPEGTQEQITNRLRSAGSEIFSIESQTDLRREAAIRGKLIQHIEKLKSERELVKQLASNFDPADTAFHIDLGFWSSLNVLLRLSRRYHVFYTIHTPLKPRSAMRRILWKLKGSTAARLSRIHFLASNGAARKSLEMFLPEWKVNEVKVAYSGIDVEEITQILKNCDDRSTVRSRVGASNTDFLIVLVGQFIDRKGAHVLLDALPEIAKAIPYVRIVWLAMRKPDGILAERSTEASRSFPFQMLMGDEVGGRAGVLELQSAADLFLLPSFEEGLPIALVEAMALSVPCIATDVGAVGEAIEDGVTGTLIRPGDPRELASRIIELEREPILKERLAANARRRALEKFDNRDAAKITVDEYKRVLFESELVKEFSAQR